MAGVIGSAVNAVQTGGNLIGKTVKTVTNKKWDKPIQKKSHFRKKIK